GDGRLDLAFTFRTNVFARPNISTILGHGDGTFTGESAVDDGSYDDTFVTGADLNNDGISDLLALSRSGKARVWPGQGDGTFQLAQTVVFSSGSPAEAVIGDFNGDLLPDLAVTMDVSSPPGLVAVVLNTTTDFTMSASALTPAMLTAG